MSGLTPLQPLGDPNAEQCIDGVCEVPTPAPAGEATPAR